MTKNSIKKNYIYNLIYQIFLLITPLIVTPYISRVLLSSGVGKYSFSLSIVNYFVIFATFGFSHYAQREIAKNREDKKKQSTTFWEIYIVKLIFTILSSIVYVIFIFSGALAEYTSILLLLIINIISVGFDVSYLLQGNEEFKKIVNINLIVKILGILSIFLFVKDEEDVWKYTLINSLIILISNLATFIYVPQYLTTINHKELNCKKHIIPAFKLFIPTIAISIYGLLDRTLIGLITHSDDQVAFYEQAEKVCKIGLTVVTSLSAVMIPNNAKYFSENNIEKVNSNIKLAFKFSALIGIPIALGLFVVADNFVPWFFGTGYDECVLLIRVLCFLVISIGLNNVFGIQYLIPTNKENVFTISVTIGAIINFILNLILIKYYGAFGAAIATVIAETVILIFQMVYLKKTFKIKELFTSIYKYLVSGIVMFIFGAVICEYFQSSIINTIIIIVACSIVYALMIIVLKDSFVLNFIRNIIVKLRGVSENEKD